MVVFFQSVLKMKDEPMVEMFKTLEDTGEDLYVIYI